MRQKLVAMLAVAPLLIATVISAQAGEITSLKEAQEMAAARQLPILIDFYTQW